MNESLGASPSPRWATLEQELKVMREALNGFTLVGVLDREVNHISSMEEEIDRKTREALVAYWLDSGVGGGMSQGFD